jgi:hypothetical protein
MHNRSRNLVRFLQRHRLLTLATGILAITATFTGMEFQLQRHISAPQLECSLKTSAHRGKSLSRDLFDSRSAASRIDRIVSGALRVATSL